MTDKRIKKIEAQLQQALKSDRSTVIRALKQIKRRRRPDTEAGHHKLTRIEKRLSQSIEARLWRERNRPVPTYNKELPINVKADEIITAIAAHPVVIISGETGSGKTTQIPQFCLAAGRGVEGQIGCTQPRRIAAMTVARRIAEELNQTLGQAVGYKIRFQDRTDRKTFIKIMTDGILLAETQRDANLDAYDTIIVDEAHERSLNIDFVLGLLNTLVQKRGDLKLIITSATIDTAKFSKAFGNAPVIEVSGRMYPVETIYWDAPFDDQAPNDLTYLEMAVQAADYLLQTEQPGDLLVFMPTEQDIRETCELLEGRHYRDVTILPLYARLSAAQQKRVFRRTDSRKIIVATNIAETSITIPGIRYVIDTGLARISQYMPRSRTTALPVLPISRSSADQRQGRCGRLEDGVCVRLYTQEDYESRPLFTLPEILRANLAEVILRMIALRLGRIEDFPFIDQPANQSIKDGLNLLYELGAITPPQKPRRNRIAGSPRLTPEGRLMARLPIDPRLARMIIEAHRRGCLPDIMVIAAALSLQDPRERPADQEQAAEQAQAIFKDRFSDFITRLNIWHSCHDTLGTLPATGRLKKFCRAHFLSFKRMREWRDIHHQIVTITKEHYLKPKAQADPLTPRTQPPKTAKPDDPFTPYFSALHCSILSGFLSNIAQKKEKNFFRAAKGHEAMIFPGSGLFNRAGEWIVAAEMVETSRLFARTVARIDPNWLEAIGRPQCKYTYLHPHWERKRGEVVALEQVSLFGLLIVPQRPVAYGRINPAEATAIFIQAALVQGDLKKPLPFMRFNQQQIDDIRAMEDRLRRRDLLIDEQTLFEFYNARLAHVYSLPALVKAIKKMGGDPSLRIKKEDLLRQSPDHDALALFPDRVALGPNTFACEYRFEPGQKQDGLTVKIPITATTSVDPDATDWLVPGLYREKVTALVKGLPKNFRKHLVPVAQTVDRIVAELPYARGNLLTALSRYIHDRFALDIPTAAWPISQLPDHLKMRLAFIDQQGRVLSTSRNKSALRASAPKGHVSDAMEEAVRAWARNGITTWDFEDLGTTVTLKGPDKRPSVFHPGLATDAHGIHLRLFRHSREALESHLQGIMALFEIRLAKDIRFLKRNLALPATLTPAARYFGGRQVLEERLYERVRDSLLKKNLRTRSAFDAHADAVVRRGLHQQGQTDKRCLITVLRAYAAAWGALQDLEDANRANRYVLAFLNDLRAELTNLVPESFLALYDTDRLAHLPRYLKALAVRAQRGAVDLEKDRQRSAAIAVFTKALQGFLRSLGPDVSASKREAIETFHWMIEEYKISVFAQEIKTNGPISNKRLAEQVKRIERMT